jgi:hypothetical protein
MAVVAIALSSCAPSTPQTRIEKSPAKFTSLGKKNQELCRRLSKSGINCLSKSGEGFLILKAA